MIIDELAEHFASHNPKIKNGEPLTSLDLKIKNGEPLTSFDLEEAYLAGFKAGTKSRDHVLESILEENTRLEKEVEKLKESKNYIKE